MPRWLLSGGVIESALQPVGCPGVVLVRRLQQLSCPALALRRRGRYGLFYLDWHADFPAPRRRAAREVASLDLALATLRGPRRSPTWTGAPLVRARRRRFPVPGPRYNDRFGTEHVRDSGLTVLDYADLRAGTIPRSSTGRWPSPPA